MTSPKIHILSSNTGNDIDPTVTRTLLDFLPRRVSSISDADIVIVPVSWQSGFRFNEALRGLNKKYALLDFLEYGWNWPDGQDNLLGYGNLAKCGFLNTPEYAKLDDWVGQNKPALYFKRELYEAQRTKTILPVEWLVYLPAKPLHSKEEFDKRAFAVFNCFGLSNPSRMRLHGEIFMGAHDAGINVIDSWSREQNIEKCNWFSIYSPWQARRPIEDVYRIQRRAKISVSLFGAGEKSFRDSESCVGSILARPYDSLAWSYPWNHGENCIRLRQDHLFEDLLAATRLDGLYGVYVECQRNAENYRSENYVKNYIQPQLEAVL